LSKKKIWKFTIENGNSGVITISDELLDSESRAEARALSEFLENSYSKNEISFSTYRTDIKQNDIIKIGGIEYLAKQIEYEIDSSYIISTIQGIRYD